MQNRNLSGHTDKFGVDDMDFIIGARQKGIDQIFTGCGSNTKPNAVTHDPQVFVVDLELFFTAPVAALFAKIRKRKSDVGP